MSLLLALLLPLSAARAQKPKDKPKDPEKSVVSQNITIKGKGTVGPPVQVPPPLPDKPVLDEVLASLEVYRVDHKVHAPRFSVSGGPKRLLRPFPEPPYLVFSPKSFPNPYDRWSFEVLAGESVVYRAGGAGRPRARLEWDGTEGTGKTIARVGEPYSFRFTGFQGKEEFTLASEPVELGSVIFRETLGDTHLEVANALLFPTRRSEILESGLPYLNEMANRLRRFDPKDRPYQIVLYQKAPESKLAKNRAEALRKFFSKALLITPTRVEVEVKPWGERGDAAACVVPPEKGPAIGVE